MYDSTSCGIVEESVFVVYDEAAHIENTSWRLTGGEEPNLWRNVVWLIQRGLPSVTERVGLEQHERAQRSHQRQEAHTPQ